MTAPLYCLIGKKIKVKRKKMKMDQVNLAKLCGLTRGTISNYENGRSSMSIDRLYDISTHLNSSAKDFLP